MGMDVVSLTHMRFTLLLLTNVHSVRIYNVPATLLKYTG
jgi:hypothetical protein